MNENLVLKAYDLCLAVRDGQWDAELKCVSNGQPAACPEIIEALRQNCPGYDTEDYQRAIAIGMQNSR